jgi:hypothetical protein
MDIRRSSGYLLLALMPPNDTDQLPGRLQQLHTPEEQNTGPVNCIRLILIMAALGWA